MPHIVSAPPTPPSDEEKDSYFGRRHRWLIGLRTLGYALCLTSLTRFSLHHTALSWLSIAVAVVGLAVAVSVYTSSQNRRITRDYHDTLMAWADKHLTHWPTVDVFLPTAGEDLGVLHNTYAAVAALDYPGQVLVHVLDDSDRWEVAALAHEHDFHYHSRPDRGVLKKAGNLKYGYGITDGEFILVLDADFAPRHDMLSTLVPYMLADSDTGIVQSPQFFDTHGHMGWLQRCAGAVQEYFYRWVQPSRDALGAPICVGSCALYRRDALDESGGFAQVGHSEDVHTGVNLLTHGWTTTYLPMPLAKGLCPDRLTGFISQQYRWCAGSMSLLRKRSFHAAPLTLRARACFWTGFAYYITTAINVFVMPVPAVVLLWFLPDAIHPANSLWLLPSFALYPAVAFVHRSSWWLDVMRVQIISSFAHAHALVDTLRGRVSDWQPTGAAARTPMTTRVKRTMILWLGGSALANAVGLLTLHARGHSLTRALPMAAFVLVNLYLTLPILRAVWDERPRATAPALEPVVPAQQVHDSALTRALALD